MNDNLQQFNLTNQLIELENGYNRVSNNRFANKFNYQKKLSLIQKYVSGYNKMLSLLNKLGSKN